MGYNIYKFKRKIVLNFDEICTDKIKHISFYDKTKLILKLQSDQIDIHFRQMTDELNFYYAFVEMMEDEFIIVDKTKII